MEVVVVCVMFFPLLLILIKLIIFFPNSPSFPVMIFLKPIRTGFLKPKSNKIDYGKVVVVCVMLPPSSSLVKLITLFLIHRLSRVIMSFKS